jgi:hypothetical protein
MYMYICMHTISINMYRSIQIYTYIISNAKLDHSLVRKTTYVDISTYIYIHMKINIHMYTYLYQ